MENSQNKKTVEPPPLKVFISYSRPSDMRAFHNLVEGLRAKNCEVMMDFDSFRYVSGENPTIHKTLEEMMDQCDIAILLYSWQFLFSDYCQHIEIPYLLIKGKPLLPIHFENCRFADFNHFLHDSNMQATSQIFCDTHNWDYESMVEKMKQEIKAVNKSGGFGRLWDSENLITNSDGTKEVVGYERDGGRAVFTPKNVAVVNSQSIPSGRLITKSITPKESHALDGLFTVKETNTFKKGESSKSIECRHLFYFENDKYEYLMPHYAREQNYKPKDSTTLYNYLLEPVGVYNPSEDKIALVGGVKRERLVEDIDEMLVMINGCNEYNAFYKKIEGYIEVDSFKNYSDHTFTICLLWAFWAFQSYASPPDKISKLALMFYYKKHGLDIHKSAYKLDIYERKHRFVFIEKLLGKVSSAFNEEMLRVSRNYRNNKLDMDAMWKGGGFNLLITEDLAKIDCLNSIADKAIKLLEETSYQILHPRMFKIA